MNIDVLPEMSDTLAKMLLRDKQAEVAARSAVSMAEMEKRALDQDKPRPFMDALCRALAEGRTGLIAEIKRASPSGGLIRDPFEPAALAEAYESAGRFLPFRADGCALGSRASRST
jgi:indole-3-glycerol phosphate synthase